MGNLLLPFFSYIPHTATLLDLIQKVVNYYYSEVHKVPQFHYQSIHTHLSLLQYTHTNDKIKFYLTFTVHFHSIFNNQLNAHYLKLII
jgi:hypothetical protein